MIEKQAKRPWPYAVPTLAEARALQSFSKGQATERDQKLAFNWIVRGACRAGQDVMVAGSPDVTSYLAGRLSVSLQIGWVLGQPAESFRKAGETDG